MVGEHGMSAVFRLALRHVATHAIASGRMRCRKLTRMTGLADRRISFRSGRRCRMRIVAGSAPQLALTLTGAGALRELFRVADDFEWPPARLARAADIYRKDILQPHAGSKISEIFAR